MHTNTEDDIHKNIREDIRAPLDTTFKMQVLCKLWGIGAASIIMLTASNILLTLRLLNPSPECSCIKEERSKEWSGELVESRDFNYSCYSEFLSESRIIIGGDFFDDGESNYNRSRGVRKKCGSYGSGGKKMAGMMKDGGAFSIDKNLGRFDDRRLFKTFDKVFVGPEYSSLVSKSAACLATQSSVDRLYWMTQVSSYWDSAPISLAIFTPDVEYSIARAYLHFLTSCFPFLGKKISVHFTYPKNFPPKNVSIVLGNLLSLCNNPVAVLKKLLKQRPKAMLKWRETMHYPQNLLRNVARRNCGTEWVFLTDVDIVPVPQMASTLERFLRTQEAIDCKKCAFVIPTYEVSEKAFVPHNRSSLLNLVSQELARPFHQKVFVYNQHATNFSRWESRGQSFPYEKEIVVSHDVTSFEFFYEPFYVARDNTPPHDERFMGYGFTRNTQVYEMYVAGWKFKVLSPIFTVHWGMQIKRSRPAWRERQNNSNRKLFDGFKIEVAARYQRDPLGMMKGKLHRGPNAKKKGKT